MPSSSKVMSIDEAVARIRPGSTLATSGFVGIGTPDALLEGLAAPGVDLDREVLERMDFPPRLAHPLRTMDPRLFRDEPMGLHTRAGPEAP